MEENFDELTYLKKENWDLGLQLEILQEENEKLETEIKVLKGDNYRTNSAYTTNKLWLYAAIRSENDAMKKEIVRKEKLIKNLEYNLFDVEEAHDNLEEKNKNLLRELADLKGSYRLLEIEYEVLKKKYENVNPERSEEVAA
jgi:chromosome segregation ATPase